jgi:5'-3' exonuclease
MNQQRGRRYRSGQEKQIEDVFYGAMQQQRSIMNGDDSDDDGSDDSLTRSYTEFSIDNKIASPPKDLKIQEVEPGRFAGTFQTSSSTISEASPYDLDFDEYMRSSDAKNTSPTSFHSNTITPGTEFFENFTNRLEDHLRKKLDTDSRWAHLTVILSGPGVPGEG